MGGILVKILYAIVGSLIARVLTGAGMAVVSYVALVPMVTNAMDYVASAVSGMPGDVVAVLALGGVGEVLSIVGSALLTRVSMVAGLAALAKVHSQTQG